VINVSRPLVACVLKVIRKNFLQSGFRGVSAAQPDHSGRWTKTLNKVCEVLILGKKDDLIQPGGLKYDMVFSIAKTHVSEGCCVMSKIFPDPPGDSW
jgi:hypothetical protein